jgi:hypothetical protein
LITCIGRIERNGSEQELIVSDLPMTLPPDSIQVSGSSTQDIQLLGAKTESVTTLTAVAPEVAELKA